jgi:hypothetical protein
MVLGNIKKKKEKRKCTGMIDDLHETVFVLREQKLIDDDYIQS